MGPFPFGEIILADEASGLIEGVVVFLQALLGVRLIGFTGLFWAGTRLSHGRAAIHLSIQLQPQLALPSSGGPRFEPEFALHCNKYIGFQLIRACGIHESDV